MKFFIPILAIIGITFPCFAELSGSGTESDPYQVKSFEDFQEFASNSSYWATGVYTRLETDINLNPSLPGRQIYSTAVIAPDTSKSSGFQGISFSGVFDGNGHKITNLTINGGSNDYIGFFGYISSIGVKDFGITDCSISGNSYVGGLIGTNHYRNVSNCYSTGLVSGNSCVGGLIGDNDGGSISACYSTSSISGNSYIGGLVGYNDGYISHCYSSGPISSTGYCVGGLVGKNNTLGPNFPGIISQCYSNSLVNGTSEVGGLVGSSSGGVSNCYFLNSRPNNGIGTPLTDGQMKTKSTFTNAGWDFTNTWDIVQNNNYPFLRSVNPFSGYDIPNNPPMGTRPGLSSVINPAPYENKLIVLIHGWDPPICGKSDVNDPNFWPTRMANELNVMKNNGLLGSSWKIVIWNWIDQAHVPFDTVFPNAFEQGKLLADDIIKARSDWQHVHLIAHSAGFMVNYAASAMLLHARRDGKFAGDIHLTTLDAAVLRDIVDDYGSMLDFSRDWADNYYTKDMIWGTESVTSRPLDWAHNEDLSSVDGGLNDHGFPHRWYQATIDGKYPSNNQPLGYDNLFNGIYYGFPRSREAGEPNWQDSLDIPVGNNPPDQWDKTKAAAKAVVDFTVSKIVKGFTGFAETTVLTLKLFTGSPVYTHTLMQMPENSNYISFTYQFDSPNNGYLTVYFNENLILIGDQRFDGNQLQESGKIYVGDILEETNWLTIQLEPIGGNPSSISISNPEIGTITKQADINSDLIVNFDDFALFAGQWLTPGCNEQNKWCLECDLDESGAVDINDLTTITANWLWKPVVRIKPDLNLTGKVDFVDFSIFASQWMNSCQSPDWCYGCDFDKSKKVDIADLVEFTENWLSGQ